jgi:hypothetical protein
MARWHPLDPVTADVARRGHLTPGRSHAFVGSYGPSDEHGIHVVGIDRGRGSLSRLGGVGGIRNPSFLALHPRSTHLYAVSEVGLASDGTQGHVYALRIDGRHDGVDLAVVSRRSTAGDHPCHISVDASGTWLAVTNYGTGDIVVFPIAGDGTIGEMASRVRHVGRGADPDRQSAPHPHSTIFTPDNRFVIVADLGIDRLVVYAFDERDGSLRERFSHGAAEGAGPRHMAFHPDGHTCSRSTNWRTRCRSSGGMPARPSWKTSSPFRRWGTSRRRTSPPTSASRPRAGASTCRIGVMTASRRTRSIRALAWSTPVCIPLEAPGPGGSA